MYEAKLICIDVEGAERIEGRHRLEARTLADAKTEAVRWAHALAPLMHRASVVAVFDGGTEACRRDIDERAGASWSRGPAGSGMG